MALGGKHAESFWLPGSVSAVVAHLADVENNVRCTADVVRSERVGADGVRFTLPSFGAAGITFQPEYGVRWSARPDGISWEPLGTGNLANRGTARCVSERDGTRVQWEQEVTIDVTVPRLMMGLVQPVIDRALVPGLKGYVDAVKASFRA